MVDKFIQTDLNFDRSSTGRRSVIDFYVLLIDNCFLNETEENTNNVR